MRCHLMRFVLTYTLYYKSGKKNHTYDVVYNNGNVTSTTTTPEPHRPQNWIPVADGDLKSVPMLCGAKKST